MKLTIALLLLASLALVSIPNLSADEPGADETAYSNYLKAIQAQDLTIFKQYIPSAKLKDWEKGDAAKKLAALKQSRPTAVEVTGRIAGGKKAILMVKSGNATAEVELILEKGEWKVTKETWQGAVASAPPSVPSKPASLPSKTNIQSGAGADVVKTAYNNYRQAVFAGDVAAVAKYVPAEKMKELGEGDEAKAKLAMIAGFMPKEITIIDVTINGTSATIIVKGKMMDQAASATVEMALDNNQWKISKESWKMGDIPEPRKNEPVAFGVPGKIAFSSNREGSYEIFLINADGTGVKQLSKTGGFKEGPVWSPDGDKLAFTSHNMSEEDTLYAVNADGSGLIRLTKHDAKDEDPVWSPDGDKIAFKSAPVQSRTGTESTGISTSYNNVEIFVVNADGTGLRQLTTNGQVDYSPLSWSPDCGQIAFCSLRDNKWNIYIINADGSGEHKLTNGEWDSFPNWSPDGNRIVFIGRIDFGKHRLMVINRDGTDQKVLYDEQIDQRQRPQWSPDGARILFIMPNAGPFTDDICAINAGGNGFIRITNTKKQEESPSWSPDGQWVCFRRDFKLYIVKADGSGTEYQIDEESGDHPAWSPK